MFCRNVIGEGNEIKRIDVDVNIRHDTKEIEVNRVEKGNIVTYKLKTKSDYGFRRITHDKTLFYRFIDFDGFKSLKVLYTKGIKGPFIVKLRFKKRLLSCKSTYTYYMRFADEWRKITDTIFKYVIDKLNESKPDSKGKMIPPKFIKVDVNKRESNDALDVEFTEDGDVCNIKFIPRNGCFILMVGADKGSIWILGEDCKVPDEINMTISDEVIVSLTFKGTDVGESTFINYRLYPGKTKYRVSGREDIDDKKKVGTIDEDDEEERDEQGVIEDTTEWIDGIEVTEEEMEQLSELQEQKPQDERIEKEVIEPEIDLREAEGELIEEGTTPSGEDIEHEVDIEEMEEEEEILPDYHLDDYFKDLKPITLDIYNHKTEGLEVKVKSYPKYSSTIYTCIPKKGYIINSLYDSQRNDTVWRKYKHDKYTVVALVYTRKTQLIVLFVIDVDPNKSKVLYYRNLPSSGWRERYRESLDQCYLDTIIKGEWRISEKVL